MISTLSDALAERGFDTLTDVQQAVTAPELAEADLLVSAQTGSGKTVGFGLAIAQTLMGAEERFGPPAAPLALVVAPTRELALQVQRELVWLYSRAGARVVSCIGGMDAREERRALDRGAHIVVGTPGRLRDHITRGALDLGDIRAIVLDEADEMLDLGFREDLEFMLGAAPADRRTLLFSATVPPAIAELAKQFQRDAVRVTTLGRGTQHADIAYQVVQVAAADAEHAIINMLRFHDAPTAIVFANTRAAVSRLAARFANRGLAVVSLSGELSQDERSHALQAMRDGRARVCVATDVAARGIDLPNLDLVIHADLPSNTEGLLHRSGRTGRAGRKGISALIAPDKMANKAARLLKWAKIEAEWTHAPTPEEIFALDETRLLADPVWSADLTDAEAAFAARMVAEKTPEQIAAACLRLYRAGLSAPEELNAPTGQKQRTERAAFGPSVWFELSVGLDRRAEARWLLPLLCRAGNLDKAHIGKIRVQPETTLVEIAEVAAAGLLDSLGPDAVLEDDIRARKLDGPPDSAARPSPAAQPARPASKDRTGPRPDRKAAPRGDAPRGKPPREKAPAPRGKPYAGKSPEKVAPAPKTAAPEPVSAKAPSKPAKDAPRKPRQTGPRKTDWTKPANPSQSGAGRDKARETGSSKTRSGATDTSQRMDRPGNKKPRTGNQKPNRSGGDAPPRRKR
ncbi:DEAD/DEAH box helicase [Maritimibacter sp. HL-12]|uniref:DEAD/DEAH box helicase n=1 Tax=Maritimibacter sp. HL-12 TaxID=1162418 RepID=UPI000A0F2A01|nr:DEAD/DEAH box helicase [Maritimibacter sp. HL-12]SMH50347.1 ATP-dependent RNA helicase DeaD [Maritimibacter sp. HL-12]